MFKPDAAILKKYADVLVKFALNSGQGVKPGEVVQVLVPDLAKPLYGTLQQSILEAGAHPLMRLLPTGFDRSFYRLANDDQLTFFPQRYLKARANLIDHSIGILAEHDLHELKGIDPKKIIKSAESKKKIRDWLNKKEYQGRFTWTLALYGTPAYATEAKLSLNAYWQQIITACFLDEADPVKHWQSVFQEISRVKKKLDRLNIQKIHLEAQDIDLWIGLGKKRQWLGGGGRNIPSFEIFTSPDWRQTEGTIAFNQPLYRYGNLITGIKLHFKKGKIVEATAKQNQDLLLQMIARPRADRIGEFSLTDGRLSRITKFMANTLYDENIGGPFGNTHIAIGMAYKDAYQGDPQSLKKSDWHKLGFNDSGEHTDMMSTQNRTVTAVLPGNRTKVIYRDGQFTV